MLPNDNLCQPETCSLLTRYIHAQLRKASLPGSHPVTCRAEKCLRGTITHRQQGPRMISGQQSNRCSRNISWFLGGPEGPHSDNYTTSTNGRAHVSQMSPKHILVPQVKRPCSDASTPDDCCEESPNSVPLACGVLRGIKTV